jgi:5-(carboxyamino)imidazole ribonucleotide synthase
MPKRGVTIGIVGGGQLARMLALAAYPLGARVHVFSDTRDACALDVTPLFTIAPYSDRDALRRFAAAVDVITCEFENVPSNSLAFLEDLKVVYPSSSALHIARNRLLEKKFINDQCLSTAPWWPVIDASDIHNIADLPPQGILKSAEMGYDGKGQIRLNSLNKDTLTGAWPNLGGMPCVLEGLMPFISEISVIVARDKSGQIEPFPVTENTHEGGILRTSLVPARVSPETALKATEQAVLLANALNIVGLLAVEFFVLENGSVVVNEMAPRPHNSGHWTIEGCSISQFGQLARILLDLPLFPARLTAAQVTMCNLLGDEIHQPIPLSAHIHDYGKKEIKAGRKMGHYTLCEML